MILILHILTIIILTANFNYTSNYNTNHCLQICCHNTQNGIFIILKCDFSQELYVLPDDDIQCAIETCRSSEIILM
jgi:hypothetical protein